MTPNACAQQPLSVSTVEHPWSADRVNVFISTLASHIQPPSTAVEVMHFDVRLKA